ncbi:peptidase M14 [Lichenicoccus sp.]|uniref:peptidase M14 n=1 Tax=Lichenicoccus sp. TaxID=2781899 RepID=UPI003D09B1F0
MSGDLPPYPLPGITASGLAAAGLPRFEVRLAAPDLSDWLPGNCGVAGFMHFESVRPGPHVAITALMHGNEIAGAIALDGLLRSGIRPRLGRLTLGFLNLAAFGRFDPAHPTASRFVEEDMNRLWDRDVLASSRESLELTRARAVQPIIDSADILLDLHSMLWPSDPLILSGPTQKGRRLARSVGVPALVVADRGHSSGPRLIDYAGFADERDPRIACLVEAGPHWEAATVRTARLSVASLLRQTGLSDEAPTPAPPDLELATPDLETPDLETPDLETPDLVSDAASVPTGRCAEVTHAVTAATSNFSFVRPYRGGEVIARQGTLIAHDGTVPIYTPYDDCLLVMPSLRPTRGHTAMRLARFLAE